jgi:ribosomal protein S20
MILYTGFLNNKAVRKFVIATFLETMRDIIENLSGEDVQKLDKKFVASMVEGQELIMKNSPDRDLLPEDKVFNHCVAEMMDKSGHFNTEFWVDVKPGYVHKILTSKAKRKVITQVDKKLLGKYVTSDVRGRLEKAMDNHDYTSRGTETDSYGYSFLFKGEIPDWEVNNRVTYGHRLPCPRMTSDIPVDDISKYDWSFFTEELGYEAEGRTINFQDYQKELFEDDWSIAEKQYRQKRRKDVEEKEKEEEQNQMEKSELRETTAQQKLRTMVAEKGVPSSWRDYHRQIMKEMKSEDQLPQEFSMKQMENYTQELREELEDEEEQMKSEQYGFEEIEEIANHMVEQPRFVFGCTSKSKKQRETTKHLVREHEIGKDLAEDIAEDVVEEAVSILLYPDNFDKPIIADTHHPKVDEDEYDEWIIRRKSGDSDNEKSEVEDSEADSDDAPEPPGMEWICLCGTLNEEDRSVCRNCTKEYSEAADDE